MTRARQHSPQTQQTIADTYLAFGKELGATVVPVGLAWRAYLAEHDRPLLYDRKAAGTELVGSSQLGQALRII